MKITEKQLMISFEELLYKISNHRVVYESMHREIPPYRLTIQENELLAKNLRLTWPKDFKNENLYIDCVEGVKLQLCVLVGEI